MLTDTRYHPALSHLPRTAKASMTKRHKLRWVPVQAKLTKLTQQVSQQVSQDFIQKNACPSRWLVAVHCTASGANSKLQQKPRVYH